MISRIHGSRSLGSASKPDSLGISKVYVPTATGETGECAGTICIWEQNGKWSIVSINIKDHEIGELKTLSFSDKEDCIIFVVQIYEQIKATRNSSPVPNDIRDFIEVVGRELEEEERQLRSAFSQLLYRSRWLSDIAKKYGIGDAYDRVDRDSAKTVREVLEWTREGDSHPFFTDETLDSIMHQYDKEKILFLINKVMKEIDPIEAIIPREKVESA